MHSSLPPVRKQKSASLLAILLLASLGLSGCEMKLPPMPWDPPADPKAEQGKDEHAEASEEDDSGAVEEAPPLDQKVLLPPSMRNLPFEEITISLKDQLQLYGKLYDPKLQPESEEETEEEVTEDEEGNYIGPKYPLVILLHGLNKNNTAWSEMPAILVKAGYAVFAVDMRGHGKSTRFLSKKMTSWRLLEPEEWLTLHQDIAQVIQHFKKNEEHPEVDGTQVSIIGEKLGANVATFVAKNNREVKAQVLMSPGMVHKGIDASRGLLDYGNPTMIITTQEVKESYTNANHLYNWITGPKTMQIYDKIGEGTDMFSRGPSVAYQIKDWLVQQLPPYTAPGAAPTPEESSAPKTEPAAANVSKEPGKTSAPAAHH